MKLSEIEKTIDELMLTVKPELRRCFEYIFSDYDKNESGPAYHNQATLTRGLRPAIMTFYLLVIQGRIKREKWNDQEARDYIKRVISHEITHLFTLSESQANSKQRENKYFVNN